jgi:hypothetical protein
MTFTIEQIPWPLWASFALALIVIVRLLGARYAQHPMLPFAAGVLVGLLLATTVVRASGTPRPAHGPQPAPPVGEGHEGVVPPPIVRELAPAPPSVGPSPTPSPTATRSAGDGAAPDRRTLRGYATWYRTAGLVAAAGPALRRALGRGWRGQRVTVCAERCVRVTLADWCACGPRHGRPTLLDLSDDAFARLAPLSRGVIAVVVR